MRVSFNKLHPKDFWSKNLMNFGKKAAPALGSLAVIASLSLVNAPSAAAGTPSGCSNVPQVDST
ncbi:hypothetical protein [Streptomyces cinereoruber]|uniref:hypothetical protein n=1 Tax=Streptomyces cinereoruber TaxID=67260 RepID=UPI003635B3E0